MIEPGLHRDLDFQSYAAIPAVNSGVVKWGGVSMRHMKDALEGRLESDDTRDRKFGRAIHCRLLEPERFATDILVSSGCSAQKKNGEMCSNAGRYFDGKYWFCGTHRTDDCSEPTDYVGADEAARIEEMAAALKSHAGLAIARRHGWSEVSIVGELHGVLCKGRLDRVPEEMDIIIDVKKTQVGAASDAACCESIARYGWHRQAAIYVDLLRQNHPVGAEPRYAWAFIEDGPPYGVNVIFADDETIECGRWEVEEVLTQWKRANQYQSWPDYMPDPRRPFVGGLPAWYRQQWHKRKAVAS